MPADSAFYCMDKITIHTLTPFSQFPKFHSVRIWKCSGIYTYSCNGRRETARAASTKCLKNLSTVVEQDLPTGNTWWRYFVLLQQVQPICRARPWLWNHCSCFLEKAGFASAAWHSLQANQKTHKEKGEDKRSQMPRLEKLITFKINTILAFL